jgi:hypothetical protein
MAFIVDQEIVEIGLIAVTKCTARAFIDLLSQHRRGEQKSPDKQDRCGHPIYGFRLFMGDERRPPLSHHPRAPLQIDITNGFNFSVAA